MRAIDVYDALPNSTKAQVLGRQLIRSGTSVAANFREASRARSNAEFAAKLGIVEQELDETQLWLELVSETGLLPAERLESLIGECDELLSIVVTAIKSSRSSQ